MLSHQPRLLRITSTVLLCCWGQQSLKDMMSHGTDFETHTIWQGYIEEPAAKDFVARNAHTIALSKAQGTHWNVSRCEEHLANCPEAVLGQGTINLDSQVWKSFGDSLPKLYCVDLAEAYVTQESASSRSFVSKKGMIRVHPKDVCTRNLRQKAERGKNW
jgi:hypothetical protein